MKYNIKKVKKTEAKGIKETPSSFGSISYTWRGKSIKHKAIHIQCFIDTFLNIVSKEILSPFLWNFLLTMSNKRMVW